MGKKIRLGNCESCEGFVLVDIADGTVSPLVEACRHCGVEIDRGSVIDVPVTAASRSEDDSAVVCDNCGERWTDVDFGVVIDQLGRCPYCKPSAYEALPADS